jgi:6,7-dimethyl-8-ribityllumazine synthase
MATASQRAETSALDARHLVIGVISTRWNDEIVQRLTAGAQRALRATGAGHHAVVVLGAVIRGETTHYELVSENCARGIMDVQIAAGIPIGMGVLTVENETQALARSEPDGGHNVGEEATLAAIEMALLAERQRSPGLARSGPT